MGLSRVVAKMIPEERTIDDVMHLSSEREA